MTAIKWKEYCFSSQKTYRHRYIHNFLWNPIDGRVAVTVILHCLYVFCTWVFHICVLYCKYLCSQRCFVWNKISTGCVIIFGALGFNVFSWGQFLLPGFYAILVADLCVGAEVVEEFVNQDHKDVRRWTKPQPWSQAGQVVCFRFCYTMYVNMLSIWLILLHFGVCFLSILQYLVWESTINICKKRNSCHRFVTENSIVFLCHIGSLSI